MLEIPPVVARKAAARGAADWLTGLPAVVGELAGRWSLAIGATFAGGTEALVLEATLADGTPAVLKLPLPGLEAGHELTALRLARGTGLALVLRADEDHGVWLLERLGRPLAALGLPLDRR